MKKNLIKILFIMLFLLTVAFTFVFDNNTNVLAEEVTQTEEVVEPSLNIYKKNISYSSEIYIMYAVSYEGIDASTYPVKMLFFDAVQDEYTTSTAAYVADSQGSANIVGVNCQIFASNGLAAKQMTDDIYARAYVEVEGQTIYSEVVKYSVLEYYHEIKEEGVVPTNILNLLEAMVNYGAAAQINFNYNTEKLANATYYKVNVENTVLPDGFTSGRFKAEEEVTLTAPEIEGYVFKNWTNANGDIVSTEATYTLTVVQDETLTANYEEEVAVTPVTLTLTKEVAYDATADTLELPSTVTFDYNNETVTENVTWDTASFVVNKIGKQKLYGTLSNDSYKVNELSIEIDVLPYTFSLNEETNEYSINKYYGNETEVVINSTFNNKKVVTIKSYAFYECNNIKTLFLPETIRTIEMRCFSFCNNLMNIYYLGTIESWCNIIFDDEFSNPMCNATNFYMLDEFNNWKEITQIDIPDTINNIGNYQFYSFENVLTISMSDNVMSLGNYCFSFCKKLENIMMSPRNLSLGDYAFYGCESLNYIELPYGMKSIGSHVFGNCNNLISLEFPSTLTSVGCLSFNECTNLTSIFIPNCYSGDGGFLDCVNLRDVYYQGDVESWCKLEFNSFTGNPMCNAENLYFKNSNDEWVEVTTLNIPDSISLIGDYQFYGFGNVTKIELSNNVKEIGKSSFYNCKSLISMSIPESVKNIGGDAFYGCKSLVEVNIPNELTVISARMFSWCTSLNKIIILNNIINIGAYSFNGCTNLSIIYNLSNLELTIGSTDQGCVAYYAKYIHNELPREIALEKEVAYDATVDTLDLPESVTFTYNEEEITQNVTWDTSTFVANQIGEQVIYGTFNDDELYDQYNIKRGGIYFTIDVFPYTFSLDETTNEYAITKYYGTTEEETIPATFNNLSIVEIKQYAFENVLTLKNLIIPATINKIEQSAIYGCNSLESITIPFIGDSLDSTKTFGYIFGASSFTQNTSYIPKSLRSIIIPSSITSIGSNAFYLWSSLTNVYYEGTIESWCNISFYNADSNPMVYAEHFYMKNEEGNWYEVTEIVITNTISKIGNYQFIGFENVTSIELPSSISNIGQGAFQSCSGLTSIELPETLMIVEDAAFDSCRMLNNLYYNGTIETWCNVLFSTDGSLGTNPMFCAEHFYMKNEEGNWYEVTEIVIPNTISKVGTYQFIGFENVTSIEIPESITSIGTGAFSNCRSLTSIVLPNSVTSIGSSAFYNCSSLTTINIPEGVTSIKNSLLERCSSLVSVIIPNSVTSIEGGAFKYCSSLKSITLPSNIISIGSEAFGYCTSLISIELPSSIISIGNSAFNSCTNLNDVYYTGTEEQWNSIVIGSNNTSLTNATIHYNYVPSTEEEQL